MTAGYRVLVVCTGNICRSAVAERLIRGMAPDGVVTAASAGTHARIGEPIHPYSEQALQALGGDPQGFAARQVTAEMVDEADVVLTATRQHRAAVVGLLPKAVRKTFTLLEFGALAELVEVDRGQALLDEVCAVRGMLQAPGDALDLPDPYGGPRSMHDAITARIRAALERPIGILAGNHLGGPLRTSVEPWVVR